jgi:serine phosphatase RsbU (regulator of sigma subunit)
VLTQKKLLEEKNKEVADSINYASRIQKSIMPDEAAIKEIIPNGFVVYKPKDIVSGDFYWLETVGKSAERSTPNIQHPTTSNELIVFAVADCTGHGVPGAFMSLIGATILNQTLSMEEITNPGEALDFLNIELPKNIKNTSSSGRIKDGMEICMCSFHPAKMELHFAGANNNLYLVRNNELNLYKGDKRPIGGGYDTHIGTYTNQVIALQKGDMLYLSTDGFPDQFGGPKGKKFKYRQMEEIFLSIHALPPEEQKKVLEKRFMEWKGDLDQVDDVCIVGMRI